MGKKKKPPPPDEINLLLPSHPSRLESSANVVDTHTHLLSTFSEYRMKYPAGKYETLFAFVKGLYTTPGSNFKGSHVIESIVDVWCEAPVRKEWKEIADSALHEVSRNANWGGMQYYFVMGVHPHEAKLYSDKVHQEITEAMSHPRCVGWGEIGLDYHYDNSPREIQREVFTRQLRSAVALNKPITIHTREASEDVERILKQEVPKDHKIHVHCFTDELSLAVSLLDHFPNLFIGITGVITYSTNENTSAVIKHLAQDPERPLRIVLETDAPYMAPSNIYDSLPAVKGRLPLCHTGMVPWTAEFVAGVAGEPWTTDRVLKEARENAHIMYGV